MKFGKTTRIKFVYGQINVRVAGQETVTHELTGIIKRSSDLRVPFEAFRPVWIDAIEESFNAGGQPVPWPELSPAYAGWKSQVAPSQPIMRLSDKLYDSLTSRTSDTIWDVGPRSIRYGSRLPYFIYHQEGTSKMPARPVVTLPPQAAAALVSLIMSYIRSDRARL